MTHREQNMALAEAFGQMNGDVMDLINKYAADFRQIINDYEKMHGRTPTANDLLYISSQHHNRDIRHNN